MFALVCGLIKKKRAPLKRFGSWRTSYLGLFVFTFFTAFSLEIQKSYTAVTLSDRGLIKSRDKLKSNLIKPHNPGGALREEEEDEEDLGRAHDAL